MCLLDLHSSDKYVRCVCSFLRVTPRRKKKPRICGCTCALFKEKRFFQCTQGRGVQTCVLCGTTLRMCCRAPALHAQTGHATASSAAVYMAVKLQAYRFSAFPNGILGERAMQVLPRVINFTAALHGSLWQRMPDFCSFRQAVLLRGGPWRQSRTSPNGSHALDPIIDRYPQSTPLACSVTWRKQQRPGIAKNGETEGTNKKTKNPNAATKQPTNKTKTCTPVI